jgi:hypothetical protein
VGFPAVEDDWYEAIRIVIWLHDAQESEQDEVTWYRA